MSIKYRIELNSFFPPSISEIMEAFEKIRLEYPDATWDECFVEVIVDPGCNIDGYELVFDRGRSCKTQLAVPTVTN